MRSDARKRADEAGASERYFEILRSMNPSPALLAAIEAPGEES